MTPQEVFNSVWEHFIVQKQPLSYNHSGSFMPQVRCRLRDDYGNKCAIGVLIPDDKYNPTLEEIPLAELPPLNALDSEFLFDLRRCHDDTVAWLGFRFVLPLNAAKLDIARLHMRGELLAFGQKYNLEIPEVMPGKSM